MKTSIARRIIAVGALIMAAGSAQATIIGVKEITITSAAPTWLQVAEVYAYVGVLGDVATTANGATAIDNGGGGYYQSSSNAIDGINNGVYPNIFHSSGSNASQFMTVILSAAFDLEVFAIAGRSDCCSNRDVYNVSFQDANGAELYSLMDFNANQRIQLPNIGTPTGVPEPTTVALLGLGLLALRRQRRT